MREDYNKHLKEMEIPEGTKAIKIGGIKYKQCRHIAPHVWVSEVNTYVEVFNRKLAICVGGKDKGQFIRHPSYNWAKDKNGNRTYLNSMHLWTGKRSINFAWFVLDAFKGQVRPGKNYDADHKNTDVQDNRACNLQWLTHKDNCHKKVIHCGFLF